MKTYQVIWIDDEHDTQQTFFEIAEDFGIEIHPFKVAQEGVDYFRNHKHQIDGLILDAKTFTNSESEIPSRQGLTRALTSISQIDDSAVRVVLTGQADYMTDEEFKESLDGIRKFNKTDDTEAFFNTFQGLMDRRGDRVIREENDDLFKACDGRFLESEDWGRLRDILKFVRFRDEIVYEDQFNALRKVVEKFLKRLNKIGLLPDDLVEPTVNLTNCSRLLSGKSISMGTTGVIKSVSEPMPPLLSSQLQVILEALHTGSHTDELPGKRILESSTLMLADVITWASNYCSENSDFWKNQKTWSKKTTISEGEARGKLKAVKGGFWLESECGIRKNNVFIRSDDVDRDGLSHGDEVTVEFSTTRKFASLIK